MGDRVLVKPEENMNKTNSGLYLPPGVQEKEKVQGGYEPWRDKKSTKYIPLQAREADFAVFLRKDAIEVEIEKEKFVIVSQAAILLLYRDEDLLN